MRVGKSKGGQVRVGNYLWPDMDSFIKTICQPFASVFFYLPFLSDVRPRSFFLPVGFGVRDTNRTPQGTGIAKRSFADGRH